MNVRHDGHKAHIRRASVRFQLMLGVLGLLGASVAAQAQGLSDLEAREIIGPWYSLFSVATRGDVRATQQAALTPDYESCAGYLPSECRDRDATVKLVDGFAKSIPDLRFDIKEVLVSGDRVVVRGELTGTPAGDLFGAPHSGKSFRMMTIDIQTVRDGRIAKTFHIENWLSALRQVRAE